jgi:flavodoxin
MLKAFVVYETKYGNTKLVAEKIVEGMREVEGIETSISDVKEVSLKEVVNFDVVLVGSPNHIGRPARGIEEFIDRLGKLDLKGKWVTVFDTHMASDERVLSKMGKRIGEKVPGLKLITPGLSIKVNGIKGPIAEGEIQRCMDFGRKIANQLKT